MNWSKVAKTAWQQSQNDFYMMRRHEWLTAMICAKKTAAWRDAGISENIADKLRGGWAIYETLRNHNPIKARELRQKYSYRRFLDMGIGWIKYEFEPAQAIDHLESELSNAAMTMQIIDAHDPRPEWYRRAQGMIKQSEVIFTSYDAPEEFKQLVKPVREYLERYKL